MGVSKDWKSKALMDFLEKAMDNMVMSASLFAFLLHTACMAFRNSGVYLCCI